jgi:GNAT superfamily N-acetyltransferase
VSDIQIIEADPAHVDELLLVRRGVDAELSPDEPPMEAPELEAEAFRIPASRPQTTWLARIAGEPAGYARARFQMDFNTNQVDIRILVRPEHRRRGVGTALLHTLVEAAPADREVATAWVQGERGYQWSEQLGLTARQVVRESRLDVAAVDPEQQRAWIEDNKGRADGYRVISWRGAYPEELTDEICAAYDAMADAPLDDMEYENVPTTAQQLRDHEYAAEGRFELFGSLALGPHGEPAGITELELFLHRPTLGDQGDTGVSPAHRGRSLGRWLKAANLAQVRAAYPELRYVFTHNAESNPWMLAINEEMGFRPHKELRIYQGPLPTV